MQQKVDRSIPSCDDFLASKGHNHKMLLTFPMALNPFATMQEKCFSMSYPIIINAKLNLLICFSLAMFDVVSNEGCFFQVTTPI